MHSGSECLQRCQSCPAGGLKGHGVAVSLLSAVHLAAYTLVVVLACWWRRLDYGCRLLLGREGMHRLLL